MKHTHFTTVQFYELIHWKAGKINDAFKYQSLYLIFQFASPSTHHTLLILSDNTTPPGLALCWTCLQMHFNAQTHLWIQRRSLSGHFEHTNDNRLESRGLSSSMDYSGVVAFAQTPFWLLKAWGQRRQTVFCFLLRRLLSSVRGLPLAHAQELRKAVRG